jgi:nicotinate-nucleotide adenylyltransferase
MSEAIGIFGGTFDPPHLGHLILAAESFDQLGLDRLLWVLTPNPPHKLEQALTPLEHRLAMTLLMLADYPHFELSRAEIDRPGPHYMLETIQLIKGKNPGAGLFLLMGGDSLSDLPDWYHPSELLSACESLGVMRRPGDTIDLTALEITVPGVTDKVKFVDAPLLEISSRDIRRLISKGHAYRHYLTPLVFEYIRDNNLYK